MTALLCSAVIVAASTTGATPKVSVKDGLSKIVKFEFIDVPLYEVAHFVQQTTGLSITVGDSVKRNAPVNLRVRNMRVRSLLSWVAKEAGCGWIVSGNKVVFTTPERAASQARARKRADSMTVPAVVQSTLGVRVILGGGTVSGISRGQTVPIERNGRSVGEVKIDQVMLNKVAGAITKGTVRKGDTAVVGKALWIHKARAKLARPISPSFKETPLWEVMVLLSAVMNLSIVLHADVKESMPVTMKVKDMPASEFLKKILDPHRLTYELRDEAVLVRRR